MRKKNREIEFAIEVFVRGHSAGRSRTFPYEASRVGPLWINTRSVEFRTVPSFYAVASSVPLNDLAGPAARSRHELGTEELRLTPRGSERSSQEEIDSFRTALIRNQQRVGLFTTVAGNVSFLGDTLFRTRIVFPANSPPGDYQVQVLQFADGEVVGAQTSKLEIAKMGIEAELFDFSLARPALYGLSGILIALAAGWAANLAFRRA